MCFPVKRVSHESYCADCLAASEREEFLAVGERVGPRLNPRYVSDRSEGKAESLPDLLSVKREGDHSRYRLREVKFKLDEAIVDKAVAQLASGARSLVALVPGAAIDRLEIAVPLRDRTLKAQEREFLGKAVAPGRYRLRRRGRAASLVAKGTRYPVTVVVL